MLLRGGLRGYRPLGDDNGDGGMNAILKNSRFAACKPAKSSTARQTTDERTQRYDSPEQEKLAKYVLEKHKVALSALAK